MKRKFSGPIKLLLTIIPWLHLTLIIVPLFASAATHIWGYSELESCLMGATIFVPVFVTYIAAAKLKGIIWYVLISLVLIALWFAINPILGVVTAFMCIWRMLGYKAVLNAPHWAGLLAFILPVVFSAANDLVVLQLITFVLMLIYAVMTFVFRSLRRLDNYIEMNMTVADFPAKRVSRTTLNTVLIYAMVLLVAGLTILLMNFDYLSIGLPEKIEIENSEDQEEEELEYQDEAAAMKGLEALDMGEPLFDINWNIVGPIIVTFVVLLILLAVIVILLRLAEKFRENRGLMREEKDVIESITSQEEKLESVYTVAPVLDFSPNAVVRRKYRKTIRNAGKELPGKWMTPAEIEKYAQISHPTLHELYEKARYSENGCTPEDKKRL